MAHDVFISYSTKNKKTAEAVCAALEENGIRAWIAPRDITPGKEWGEAIVTAISESKVMVLIFSAAANQSQQVLREVERAVNKNVVIVPFRIENVVPTKSMEYFLYSTHWLDALTPDMEKHITELTGTVGKLVSVSQKNGQASEKADVREKTAAREETAGGKANSRQKLFLFIAAGVTAVSLAFGAFGIWMAASNSGNAGDKQDIAAVQSTADTAPADGTAETELPEGTAIPAGTTLDTPAASTSDVPETSTLDVQTASTKQTETGSRNKPDDTGTKVKAPPAASRQDNGKGGKAAGTGTVQPAGTHKEQGIELKVGDYIKFGTYIGQPVDWRIINIDKNGCPLLFSNSILGIKPFDVAEGANTTDPNRSKYGSNYWINSNIREWLNSSDRTVKFTGTPPTGENAYNAEPGFLYAFSGNELKMLKNYSHSVLLPDPEKNLKDAGTELFSFKEREKLNKACENFDSSFRKTVQDKVFLLSVKEAKEYIWDRGWDIRAKPTPQAEARDENCEYKYLKHETDDFWAWWLDTPCAVMSDSVQYVNYEGYIDNNKAFMTNIGVRPALYLSSSRLELTGQGTENDPYVLKDTGR